MGQAFCTDDSSDAHDDVRTPTVHDKYDVGMKLGSGAFGEVRRGVRRKDNRAFAVKIVDQNSESLQAFETVLNAHDEATILQEVRHPNIVDVVDVFESDRFLYVVMELVGGGELFKAIAQPTINVSEADIANVSMQLLDALGYLHELRIVHRDVKAENVLLTEPPSGGGIQGSIKLIDFGLSARLQPDTCNGVAGDGKQLDLICGTPQYAAPEIWASGQPDAEEWREEYGTQYGPKVDVWAAGVLVYVALLGTYPFNGQSPAEVMKSACSPESEPSFEPHRMKNVGAGYKLSAKCQEFLDSLLQKDQDERPSARDAVRDPWLSKKKGGKRALAVIPHDVRAAALQEMLSAQANARRPPAPLQREREAAFAAERAAAADSPR